MNDKTNVVEHELIDHSTPATPSDVFRALDKLGIMHSTIEHPPMRTVLDSRALRDGVPGGYSKNLFLRNRKGRMVLVTMLEDRIVNLKALGEMIGIGKPGFASPQRLMHYLGVVPGAVTPLAVINDVNKAVMVVLDKALLARDPLHFHPCDNRMTTTLCAEDLLKYMQQHHTAPRIIDLDTEELLG